MKPEELARRLKAEKFDKLRLMNRIVLTAEANVKREAPVKRGTLRRSITHRVEDGGNRGIVGTNLDYALPVHQGSKAHTIVAKTKKALFWKGAEHPVRSVKHPGTKANPFMERGLERSRARIEELAAEAGVELFSRIAR